MAPRFTMTEMIAAVAVGTLDHDKDGLERLNRTVVEALRRIEARAALVWRIGQRVTFADRFGRPIVGTIEKINRSSVTVHTDQGRRWRVSPSLLVAEGGGQ